MPSLTKYLITITAPCTLLLQPLTTATPFESYHGYHSLPQLPSPSDDASMIITITEYLNAGSPERPTLNDADLPNPTFGNTWPTANPSLPPFPTRTNALDRTTLPIPPSLSSLSTLAPSSISSLYTSHISYLHSSYQHNMAALHANASSSIAAVQRSVATWERDMGASYHREMMEEAYTWAYFCDRWARETGSGSNFGGGGSLPGRRERS
jgi:hypothetical protein